MLLILPSAQAADPALVGQWPGLPRGKARDVFVVGTTAYVAIGLGGLAIFDVSNPANPTRRGGYGTSGFANAV